MCCVEFDGVEVGMVGAAGREWRLVKSRRGMMGREIWTSFVIEARCQRSPNRDNTLKSSIVFEKLSPQIGIVRWAGRGSKGRYLRAKS